MLNTTTGELVAGRCGMWSCESCAIALKRQARKRIRLGLEEDDGRERPKFLTLTSRPGEWPHASMDALTERYRNLTRHLRRSFPTATVEYFLVPERTKRGALHVHVVVRGLPFLPQTVWSRLAERFGFGSIVWIEQVKSVGGMGAYLTKALGVGAYMTKDLATHRWPPGFRRIRASQGWSVGWVPRARRARPADATGDVWMFVRIDRRRTNDDDDRGRAGRIGPVGVD